jgi:acetyl esterase/lipase
VNFVVFGFLYYEKRFLRISPPGSSTIRQSVSNTIDRILIILNYGEDAMLRFSRILIVCTVAFLCTAATVSTQEAPEASGGANRPESAIPKRGGRSGNTMVSMMPPANVNRIRLYEKTPNVVEGTENELNPMEPTLDLYIPDSDRATGAGVLLCPGGGYSMLTVPGEGATIAEFFKSHNIAAFVLRYRHGPQYHYPTTLLDAQRALRLIRSNAKDYHVDPDKVGVFGGSAGGHLAAMLATLHDSKLLPEAPYVPDSIDSLSARPAFTLLLYPVIDMTDDAVTHQGSRTNLTQDNADLYEPLSPWKHVAQDTPPAFIVHGAYDFLVQVKNSLLYFEACLKARVPVEMHLVDTPQHGFGMGSNMNDETVKEWPEQALRFLVRHGGISAD